MSDRRPAPRTQAGAGRRAHLGRRPGAPDTRHDILHAARELFAARGYERTTIRAVAAAAHVDPALVHHYFGTKDDLLAAALTPPLDVAARVPLVLNAVEGTTGERVARAFLSIWEDPELRPVYMAIVRCASSHSQAADIMRGVLARQVIGPMVAAMSADDAPLRATLIASQLIGLAMVRYLTRLEPLAQLDLETLVAAVAPTIDRYLTAPLREGGGSHMTPPSAEGRDDAGEPSGGEVGIAADPGLPGGGRQRRDRVEPEHHGGGPHGRPSS